MNANIARLNSQLSPSWWRYALHPHDGAPCSRCESHERKKSKARAASIRRGRERCHNENHKHACL